uniref:Uncharacterized protein n=1 Tax=Anguilla anguilla TaxID=7936 RepID=A0A0E9T507_ANGAN
MSCGLTLNLILGYLYCPYSSLKNIRVANIFWVQLQLDNLIIPLFYWLY